MTVDDGYAMRNVSGGGRNQRPGQQSGKPGQPGGADSKGKGPSKRPPKKMSEYGKQLHEKQKVKRMYGMREKQFHLFFDMGVRMEGAPGTNLLSLLERRLDNVIYRLKMAISRSQARQMVVHGHVMVNGKKVRTPSYRVGTSDQITLRERSLEKKEFLDQVVDKRLKLSIKVPEWLELDTAARVGKILRNPERTDVQMPIEEHLIVELYSK